MTAISAVELDFLRTFAADRIPGTIITVEFSQADGHNIVLRFPGKIERFLVADATRLGIIASIEKARRILERDDCVSRLRENSLAE